MKHDWTFFILERTIGIWWGKDTETSYLICFYLFFFSAEVLYVPSLAREDGWIPWYASHEILRSAIGWRGFQFRVWREEA